MYLFLDDRNNLLSIEKEQRPKKFPTEWLCYSDVGSCDRDETIRGNFISEVFQWGSYIPAAKILTTRRIKKNYYELSLPVATTNKIFYYLTNKN